MKIKLYWPKCDLHDNKVDFAGDDAFFLECSIEEAKEQIFSYLTDVEIKESISLYNPIPDTMFLEYGIDTSKSCFLITKDLKKILPMKWSFPYSPQWNGDSPFEDIKEIELKYITEIKDIIIESIDDNISYN